MARARCADVQLLPQAQERAPVTSRRPTQRVTVHVHASLDRYAGLADLTAAEYREFFRRQGKPWTCADQQYLVEWWGREDTLSLAYALERPPWSLQRKVSELRHAGRDIPYTREERRM